MKKEYLNEIWKDVEGYEGLYQVSNLGRVKSLEKIDASGHRLKEIIMKADTSNGRYLRVSFYKDKKNRVFSIHRLVAKAFIPNPNDLPCVNHKDENTFNNCASNLEWCTQKYNCNYGTRNKRISNKTTGTRYNRKDLSKPILQYTIDGQFVKEWPSSSEIQRQLNYNNSSIAKCCNEKPHFNTAYGFIWKYKV